MEGYKIAGPELLTAVEKGRFNPRARRMQLVYFFPLVVLGTWLAVRRIARKHFAGEENAVPKEMETPP